MTTTAAELVHNQTPYGEKPDMSLIEDYKGHETYDSLDRWICVFPDGSTLTEDPTYGVEVHT